MRNRKPRMPCRIDGCENQILPITRRHFIQALIVSAVAAGVPGLDAFAGPKVNTIEWGQHDILVFRGIEDGSWIQQVLDEDYKISGSLVSFKEPASRVRIVRQKELKAKGLI